MTQITTALIEKLEAEVKAIEANLDIYLNSPSSQVAEHIDYIGTVEKQLEKLSDIWKFASRVHVAGYC